VGDKFVGSEHRVMSVRPVLTSSRNARIYAHWLLARGAKKMPSRHEFQPDVIPFDLSRELPQIYIAEILGSGDDVDFRFSLMGTLLADRLKQDATGKLLSQMKLGGFEEEWRRSLAFALKTKMPVVSESQIVSASGMRIDLEHLAVPLSEDGAHVDRILGSIDFLKAADVEALRRVREIDWSTIASHELAKRIVVANLRVDDA
jgi:hypothetical protein